MLARISTEQRIVDAVYHYDHGGEEPDDDGKNDGIIVGALCLNSRERAQANLKILNGCCAVLVRFGGWCPGLRRVPVRL